MKVSLKLPRVSSSPVSSDTAAISMLDINVVSINARLLC